jgi:hypothetical protein
MVESSGNIRDDENGHDEGISAQQPPESQKLASRAEITKKENLARN